MDCAGELDMLMVDAVSIDGIMDRRLLEKAIDCEIALDKGVNKRGANKKRAYPRYSWAWFRRLRYRHKKTQRLAPDPHFA